MNDMKNMHLACLYQYPRICQLRTIRTARRYSPSIHDCTHRPQSQHWQQVMPRSLHRQNTRQIPRHLYIDSQSTPRIPYDHQYTPHYTDRHWRPCFLLASPSWKCTAYMLHHPHQFCMSQAHIECTLMIHQKNPHYTYILALRHCRPATWRPRGSSCTPRRPRGLCRCRWRMGGNQIHQCLN